MIKKPNVPGRMKHRAVLLLSVTFAFAVAVGAPSLTPAQGSEPKRLGIYAGSGAFPLPSILAGGIFYHINHRIALLAGYGVGPETASGQRIHSAGGGFEIGVLRLGERTTFQVGAAVQDVLFPNGETSGNFNFSALGLTTGVQGLKSGINYSTHAGLNFALGSRFAFEAGCNLFFLSNQNGWLPYAQLELGVF